MKILLRLIVPILLLTLALPVAAQKTDALQIVELPEGYTISVPGDWDSLLDDQRDGGIYVSNADFTVYFLMPDAVAEAVKINDKSKPEGLVLAINKALYDWEPDADAIESLQIDDRDAARISYTLEGDEYEGYTYVIRV